MKSMRLLSCSAGGDRREMVERWRHRTGRRQCLATLQRYRRAATHSHVALQNYFRSRCPRLQRANRRHWYEKLATYLHSTTVQVFIFLFSRYIFMTFFSFFPLFLLISFGVFYLNLATVSGDAASK